MIDDGVKPSFDNERQVKVMNQRLQVWTCRDWLDSDLKIAAESESTS